jgi:hypothetical protein
MPCAENQLTKWHIYVAGLMVSLLLRCTLLLHRCGGVTPMMSARNPKKFRAYRRGKSHEHVFKLLAAARLSNSNRKRDIGSRVIHTGESCLSRTFSIGVSVSRIEEPSSSCSYCGSCHGFMLHGNQAF